MKPFRGDGPVKLVSSFAKNRCLTVSYSDFNCLSLKGCLNIRAFLLNYAKFSYRDSRISSKNFHYRFKERRLISDIIVGRSGLPQYSYVKI